MSGIIVVKGYSVSWGYCVQGQSVLGDDYVGG
jgi:hypothetical protein